MTITFSATFVRPDGTTAQLSASAAELTGPVVGAASWKAGQPDSLAGRLASMQAFDQALATRAGVAKPVLKFWHVYSGASFPSSFAGSSAAQAPANGWGAMLNTKMASGQIRTTAGAATVNGFLASYNVARPLYLIFRHEPENDGLSAADRAAWKADIAEFVRLVVDFGNPNIIPCCCMMGVPPTGDSFDNWDFVPNLRAGDQAKMIWLFDAYPKCRSDGTADAPGVKYDAPIAWARSKGFSRIGIAETTLNNDVGVPQSIVDSWWTVDFPAYVRAKGLEVVAVYDSTGPAAGTNGYIDQPGEVLGVANLALGR